jgi:uridine kinase
MLIAEGTYTTLLNHADFHVFIDRTYEQTLAARKERARDALDDAAERFLEIEHSIISRHRTLAEVVVGQDYSVIWVGK